MVISIGDDQHTLALFGGSGRQNGAAQAETDRPTDRCMASFFSLSWAYAFSVEDR